MNRRAALCKIPLLAGGSWFLAGCLSEEEIQRIETETGPEGTGVQFSALPKVITILATYQPTPKQVAVAREHAQVAQVELFKTARPSSSSSKPSTTASTPSEKPVFKQKTPIIAVETTPDERLKGQHVVMLWNTKTQEVVGNEAYDVEAVPKRGEVAVWGSVTAQYVGTGKQL